MKGTYYGAKTCSNKAWIPYNGFGVLFTVTCITARWEGPLR